MTPLPVCEGSALSEAANCWGGGCATSGCWWPDGCHRCQGYQVLQGCEGAALNTRLRVGLVLFRKGKAHIEETRVVPGMHAGG